MKKWQKKAIEEIMDCFDFKRVRKAMLALDWQWAGIDRTPFVSELRETAESILIESTVGAESPHFVSSGGFEVICDREIKSMRLFFHVENWEVSK